MSMRKVIPIIILVSVSFGLTMGDLYSQPAQVNELLQQPKLIEDIKRTLASNGQDIINIESNLKSLQEELEALNATREKLIEDKAEGLDSVTKQKSVVEERITTLDETMRVRTDIEDMANNLAEELDIMSTIKERKNKIIEKTCNR